MATGAAAKVVRRIIRTAKAPAAIGPYNQAVVVDRTVYLAGQIGMSPENSQLVSDSVVEQAKQALTNLGEVLEAAGSSYEKVVKTTVFLADLSDYQRVNEVYGTFFKENQPARSAFQVAALPKGARVEIEAIAIAGEVEDM